QGIFLPAGTRDARQGAFLCLAAQWNGRGLRRMPGARRYDVRRVSGPGLQGRPQASPLPLRLPRSGPMGNGERIQMAPEQRTELRSETASALPVDARRPLRQAYFACRQYAPAPGAAVARADTLRPDSQEVPQLLRAVGNGSARPLRRNGITSKSELAHEPR